MLLLVKLEKEALSVGLAINCYKTKFMTLNIPEEISLVGSTGIQLENVDDIVYLGVWISKTERNLGSGEPKHGRVAITSKRYGSLA